LFSNFLRDALLRRMLEAVLRKNKDCGRTLLTLSGI
jgi:hypothetical protein